MPAAGLRWLLVVEPRRWATWKPLEKQLEPWIPAARWQSFERSSGVDPRRLEHAVIAGFDYSTLYLVGADAEDRSLQERFRARLVAGEEVRIPHPDITVVQGVVGDTPQTMVRLHDHAVGFSIGDPTPARVVEAYARRRLGAPRAFEGAALSSVAELEGDAPLQLFVPGPIEPLVEGESILGSTPEVDGLLAASTALLIAVRPLDREPPDSPQLSVKVILVGAFGEDRLAASRLEATWETLRGSLAGHLLGFAQVETPTSVTVRRIDERDSTLELSTQADLPTLVRGLAEVVGLDQGEEAERPGERPPPDQEAHPEGPSSPDRPVTFR